MKTIFTIFHQKLDEIGQKFLKYKIFGVVRKVGERGKNRVAKVEVNIAVDPEPHRKGEAFKDQAQKTAPRSPSEYFTVRPLSSEGSSVGSGSYSNNTFISVVVHKVTESLNINRI